MRQKNLDMEPEQTLRFVSDTAAKSYTSPMEALNLSRVHVDITVSYNHYIKKINIYFTFHGKSQSTKDTPFLPP